MIDIKIVHAKNIMAINEVNLVPNFEPATIEITGPNMTGATEVLINQLPAGEFIQSAKGKLLAQVPNNLLESVISKVMVTTDTKTPGRSSLLRFEVGKTLKKTSGTQRLVQMFVKILLQTPGTDRFSPTIGGNLLGLVGSVINKRSSRALSVSVVDAVSKTTEQIISMQSRSKRTLPSSERLLSAEAEATGFNPSTTTLTARVIIKAASGEESAANLSF